MGKQLSEVKISFRRKSVYYWWQIASQCTWKLDKDPLKSARIFISQNADKYHVKLLDVMPAPGTQVLAFEVTDFLDEWGPHMQELGMDSTCKRQIL